MAKVAAASLDFFATLADMKLVLDFLFTSTDVRMFELYSQDGEKLHEVPYLRGICRILPHDDNTAGQPANALRSVVEVRPGIARHQT